MHAVVAELVARIISMAAPSPGGDTGGPGAPPAPTPSNRFARELATRESVSALVACVLRPFDAAAARDAAERARAASSVTHAIAVLVELIRKNNSDYFEPYLFHTLRNRLIHVQQQLAADPAAVGTDPRVALEAALAEMVEGMGVVHLGPLLEVVCERMDEFQALLRKPRSLVGVFLYSYLGSI
jgi:serine/threonine-protein phosphatase 6 regulatory subunit 3